MIQIKKTILTLVALLAVTTGAWADGPVDGTIAWSVGNEASATVSASIKDAISSTGVTTGSGLTVSTGQYFNTNMVRYQPATANAGNVEGVMIEYTIEAVDGYKFKPTGVDYAAVKDGTDNASYSWSYTIDGVESAITDVSINDVLRNTGSNSGTAQLMHSESITADGCSVFTLRFYISNCATTKKIGIANITISGSVSAAAASGPKVAWDKATKTGTFKMPGGNVTLAPEYYPQAALTAAPTAINDVPATTDGAIVKAGTVANIGSTETAQGTVMYYVSQSALDEAALLALAADKWTADVPTAEKLTKGQAYVYYYVRGNDSDTDEENFSDGDILAANALTVTIAAEPTYAVTFKAANTNTIEAGKATVTVGGTAATVTEGKLQGVKMGSEVKVKANTGYKFRKVEVKKGGGEPVLLTIITAADNSSFKSGSQTFGDVATVTLTGDYLTNDGSHGGWYCLGSNLTATISVAEANGANITSVKFYTAGGGSAEDKDAPFEVTTTSMSSSDITTYLNGNSIGSYGVSKIEVYGTK